MCRLLIRPILCGMCWRRIRTEYQDEPCDIALGLCEGSCSYLDDDEARQEVNEPLYVQLPKCMTCEDLIAAIRNVVEGKGHEDSGGETIAIDKAYGGEANEHVDGDEENGVADKPNECEYNDNGFSDRVYTVANEEYVNPDEGDGVTDEASSGEHNKHANHVANKTDV